MTKTNKIYPGKRMFDTQGKPIHIHGGSIITVGDHFYWYGENKEHSLPGSGIWTYGIKMYSSKDLVNWDDRGLVLEPERDVYESPLHPSQCLDRPHILFCKKTNLFVMWIKLMGRDGVQRQLITTASSVTGPYRFQKLFRPLGMSCGDFDLVLEPSDRKAYFYFERVHSEMICADLTEDYCDVTGYYSTHFVCHRPPFVREAPAYFKRGYLHYLITSGTTGYFPNKSEVALAKSFHGPWSVVGDPHPDDPEGRSFRSQISSVFKHPHKKDLYIALGDRWLSDLPESLPNVDAVFDEAYQAHPPQYDVLNLKLEGLSAMDTSKATHIWLPLRFEGERPFIDWKEEWSIEDYE